MTEDQYHTIVKKDIHQGTEITAPGDRSRSFVAVILDEEEFEHAKQEWLERNKDRPQSVQDLKVDDIVEDYTEQLLERADWSGALYDIIDNFADLYDSKQREKQNDDQE